MSVFVFTIKLFLIVDVEMSPFLNNIRNYFC